MIKGSRDPLGLQVIWYHFGRKLISNLTTQTNDARGFTVLLLGRFLAEKYVHENSAVEIFHRVEQICAYVRHIAFDESGIRGILRVKRNSRKPQKLPISSNPESTIMSNQKAYGLWGLYSVAARVSGLIPSENVGVEDAARQFV